MPIYIGSGTGNLVYDPSLGYIKYGDSTIIDVTPHPYTLGAQPYPWDVSAGTKILINASCLAGEGKRLDPIVLVSDGEVWLPDGDEQVLYSSHKLSAEYISQIAGNATNSDVAFSIAAGIPKIPYLLLYRGIGIRIMGTVKHASGATGPYLRIHFGLNGTVGDAILTDATAAASDEVNFDIALRISKLGTAGVATFVSRGLQYDSKGAIKSATTSFYDRTTSSEVDNYVTFSCYPNNQTINLQKLRISLVR